MALSCFLRNTVEHIKINPLKRVVLQNQMRPSSCASILLNSNNSKYSVPIVHATKLSQLHAVKHFSTSPVSNSTHGDHSKIWTAERILAGTMLGILPSAMLMPSHLMDTLMAVAIVMHMHWGIEAIVIDYVRPVIFGPVIPKIGVTLVYILSIATLAGLLNFIFNDVGLANGIRILWKL